MATSPSFFRILKGAEKKNDLKQSVMLDSQQSGLVIQEGTIYVTTDDGNMYIDVSSTKRIKIGALADKALQAEKDYDGNIIARYFNEASLTKTAVDNQIILQRGTSINPVILSLTGATATAAGLITTGAQTLAGNKTFTGKINIQGEAADQPLQVRGIVGSDGTTTVSDLYLQYKANKLIYLGNDGKYTISADGGQYSGNAATATKAVNDVNNKPITDYIKDVTYSVATTGDKVSFNFQRGSSNVFTHSITGATTAAAGLVTTGAQTFKGIKTFSSGTKMGASTWVNWLDSGKFTANNANETYPYDCGGLKWSEQSDAISLYAQATKRDNLDLVLNFGDDNSNSFRITDKEKTTTITMTATGDITASNFYGLASKAKADENGNQLTKTYIASLKYEAQTNTTDATNLPSIKGMAMDGTTVISTIPLPSASTGNNGLVSTTTQTFGGNKTFKNNLAVTGNTALSGTLGVTGKTTLSDVLEVTGATTLKSTLGVTGNTTLGGTLGVTGATTLTGNLAANGSVTMAQSLTISGIINSLVKESAPFVINSTTWVKNLNADKVDGYDVTNNDFSTAKDTDMSIPSVGAVIKTFLPLLQSIQGLRYRGSVDLTQTTDDTRFGKDVLGTVKVGDVFMISKGGAYAGIYLEPADMLICVAKSGSAITWNYIQSNINGAVTIKGATESKDGANPLVSVDSIPIFSAATGRQITGSKIFIDGAGHLLPASGNTKQCLGSEERKWITVYANTFNGTNFTGTTFKGTDFTGTTFTGTTFTGNAASASKWKTARTITVKGADTGSVTLDGSQDVVLTLSVAHTHNYAGSSSAGGAANSANKLNTNAGSGIQPVFFTNGVPKVCIPYAEASVKYADEAGLADYLNDILTPDEIICIGCDNDGFTAAEVNYALGMDDSRLIRNVSKAEYQKWLNLGSAAYTASSAYAAATHTHNSVVDIGSSSTTITFAYSKSALDYNSYTSLAAWNGSELRAVNKNQFAIASHSHNFLNAAPSNLSSTTSAKFTNDSGPINVRFYSVLNSITAQPSQYGFLTTIATEKGSPEMHQIWFDQPNGHIFHRGTNGDSATAHPSFKMLWEKGDAVTGAVWNDYAECRQADTQEPGYVLSETGKDTLTKTSNRLQHFAGVSSDTWGFSQGETEKAKTHIAVAGRVLVYPYQDRRNYHPGDCVCATRGGMVDIMTREEIIKYPDRIVGIVSCVPDYEIWGGGKDADREPVKVNGRIWIKVK